VPPASQTSTRADRENRWLQPLTCTAVGLVGNLLLCAGKLTIGFLFRSAALVADGIHSLTDLASDVAVLVALRASRRPPDENHPYGHDSFETLGAISVSGMMILIGLAIGWDAVQRLWRGDNMQPAYLALAMALVSVALKEVMARYTLRAAHVHRSPALLSNGIMHRTDAVTSLAAAGGILGAALGARWLDSAGALLISVFVLREGWKLTHRNIMELMDTMPDRELVDAMHGAALAVEGILEVRDIRVRQRGSVFFTDLRVAVPPACTVSEAHRLAHEVEASLHDAFPEMGRVFVHVEPAAEAAPVPEAVRADPDDLPGRP